MVNVALVWYNKFIVLGLLRRKEQRRLSERNRNQKRRDKKDVFYETEKASERMEDMHLFIQTALENKNFFTVGS